MSSSTPQVSIIPKEEENKESFKLTQSISSSKNCPSLHLIQFETERVRITAQNNPKISQCTSSSSSWNWHKTSEEPIIAKAYRKGANLPYNRAQAAYTSEFKGIDNKPLFQESIDRVYSFVFHSDSLFFSRVTQDHQPKDAYQKEETIMQPLHYSGFSLSSKNTVSFPLKSHSDSPKKFSNDPLDTAPLVIVKSPLRGSSSEDL